MTTRLFIGNLSFNVTEEQLQQAFAPYEAVSATIPTRWSRSNQKADRPKGFGYVEVPERQAAAAIAAMQGYVLDGRAIDVSEARPRPELPRFDRPRYEGGGYRGGGGGFRRR